MAFNPIAASIPIFFGLIGLEAALAWWKGRDVYRVNDAISDLSCGITSQMANLFTKGATAATYIALYGGARVLDLPDDHWGTWLFAFVFTDFAYYWWHRWTHEMNLGWASHVVHHQSEDYNLAVALRQSMTSSLTSWPFYLPMAILGVSPFVAFTCSALNTLYQFWIHTELVGKLGPIEWIWNTPSHHRVHHGINPQYLDRNYAGVFIVWDRLFGTFEPEVEAPAYGTVKPLQSWSPVWANVWWIDRMVRQSAATPRFADKVAVWWRGPGFQPPGTEPPPPRSPEKYDRDGPPGTSAYVVLHFVPVAVLTTWVLWVSVDVSPVELAAPAGLITLATITWGALYERRSWAIPLELARLVATAVWVAIVWGDPVLSVACLGIAAASGAWLLTRARVASPAA